MKTLRHIMLALLCGALVLGTGESAMAQTKGKAKSSTTAKKKKKAAPAKPAVTEVELPYNCNDCLFAIPLEVDKPYGPTTPPDGGGRVQEVMADKAHPNLFEIEHNSVWYKVSIPYNGMLEIKIAQRNQWDDYDFLVYKNTGSYFANQVMQNKVLPVAVNLAAVDSNALAAKALAEMKSPAKKNAQATGNGTATGNATTKASGTNGAKATAATGSKAGATGKTGTNGKAGANGKNAAGTKAGNANAPADALPTFDAAGELVPTIGMLHDATDRMLTKDQYGHFIKSIPVRMGEEYYIVLDNRSYNGKGHTIEVSVHVDAYEPLVLFYDRKARRYVDVDLMVLERGGAGHERPLVRDQHFKGGKIKFVPGFNYTLYAKRDGYFSVYREFAARDLMMKDTLMLYYLERTERGTTFDIKDIYFDIDDDQLIGGSDTVLMNYVAMFRNHPDVSFLVKGFVQSYGVNADADMLHSLERAKAVKDFFVKNGIDAKRITTAGMTRNEIKRAAAAALDSQGFSTVKAQIIITGKGEQ